MEKQTVLTKHTFILVGFLCLKKHSKSPLAPKPEVRFHKQQITHQTTINEAWHEFFCKRWSGTLNYNCSASEEALENEEIPGFYCRFFA